MTTLKVIGLLFASFVLLFSERQYLAQQGDDASQCSTAYENHNQIDYGPLKVRAIGGTTIIQVGAQKQSGVPGACFALFTEKEHKLVASARADSEGRFELNDVLPGRYRLVARAEGLCTANVPLEVLKPLHGRKTEILVHFRPTGIDTCSYGELSPLAAKPTPTTP
jgi:hypothetical protein